LVKWNNFECDDYDDGGALIKSSFKHFQTNLRNYRHCHALKTISALTMLRGLTQRACGT